LLAALERAILDSQWLQQSLEAALAVNGLDL
jgi:hypothetical protein